MPVAEWIYQCQHWVAGAERIYRDRCDLHCHYARRVYQQGYDQRFERTVAKLKRNNNDRSRSAAAGSTNTKCRDIDRCEYARGYFGSHGCHPFLRGTLADAD